MKQSLTWISAAILLVSLSRLAAAQRPDAETIIRHSVDANEADWKANPEYDWTESDLQPNGGTKTFQEFMISGSPYGRLIAINGKHLPTEQQQQEQRKFDAEIARRRGESPVQRQQRIAEYEKERKRDHVMMEQMTRAFNFRLDGQEKINGHDVYLLDATPKSDYQPPNMQSRALKGMQGKLWIDKATFQWVKVEAKVMHPVSIDGFLAKVLPGTRFELEKTPVDQNIWLPKHYAMRSRAKVLYMFSHKSRDDESYWNYHKAANDSAHNNGN